MNTQQHCGTNHYSPMNQNEEIILFNSVRDQLLPIFLYQTQHFMSKLAGLHNSTSKIGWMHLYNIEREKDTDYCNNMTMVIIEGSYCYGVVVYKLFGIIVLFTRDTPKQCNYGFILLLSLLVCSLKVFS